MYNNILLQKLFKIIFNFVEINWIINIYYLLFNIKSETI